MQNVMSSLCFSPREQAPPPRTFTFFSAARSYLVLGFESCNSAVHCCLMWSLACFHSWCEHSQPAAASAVRTCLRVNESSESDAAAEANTRSRAPRGGSDGIGESIFAAFRRSYSHSRCNFESCVNVNFERMSGKSWSAARGSPVLIE